MQVGRRRPTRSIEIAAAKREGGVSSRTLTPTVAFGATTPAVKVVESAFSLTTEEAQMAFARVVSFDGVSADRMEAMSREMREGERPEGLPATEIIVLHDPEAERSLAIVFFENEDDYKQGDATLNAMPTGDSPGQRTSVTKYTVAVRMQA